ncbi:uncharacterized protein LOC134708428 isoform X2 [Mytilus trossulus]|uniref:uncharacterized protein LOC134708428 isoform X2 n=1 Tax=Mytilus trossulus TaxID=6551 RepID=UPI003007DA8A
MGNCKGKLSKESKNQMRGEAYTRPSKPDTQEKETIHVEGKPVIKNDNNKDAVVINAKIPFVNPETPTKSESVMQGPNTSVSDTNGLKASGSTGKQDKKQHESDAIPQKCVEKQNKDVLSSVNIKNNIGEETNLKEAPQIDISLNKVPGSKSDDAEDDHSYLFAAGRKDEEPQIEISEFIDKKTGKSDDSAHKDVVISTNEAGPTDKATNDSSTTETNSIKKVDDLQTDDTGGNDSESVNGGSDQTKGIENNPNSKPSDKSQPDNGPSDNQQSCKPSDKSQPENGPSENQQNSKPSDKPQSENGPSDNQQSSKPSDKSQPENAASDNQQNNKDPTGYEGSKFSKPGDEQDREISEEMKNGKLNEKKKKKKKKRDKYDGPPANTVIHHYYGHAETVNIGNDNINYYNGGKEEPKIEEDEIQPNYTISALKMEILLAVSKSVGIFHGPKVNGTCWRVGEDKIITAAHVVNDNIWNKTLRTEYEQSLDKCCVDFNYVDKNKRSSKDSDLNVFKLEPQVMYKNEVLDVAVLKLKREKNKNFPPPLDLFESLDPEKDDDKVIYLIGHNKSDEKTFNFGIGLWTPTETKMKGMEKFCEEYGKPNGYIGLDRKDRLVIKCEFVSGASGCPGVVIYKDKAYVVLVYIRGFPDFYFSQQFPERKREEFPKERLLQQGVNIGSVFKTMTENAVHLGLRNEIFPIEANLEQQASGQNLYAIGGASSFQNEKNSKGQETENKNGKGTTCTEGHSETAIPDSAKYNRQPSYALAIDDRVDIAFPLIKSPVDDTDITLQHSHSQNITVPRNEQNVQQESILDVNKDSQSQMENASSEILDMVPGEKIVPYSNPGKTQPVKDITIEEWIGNDMQAYKEKQLKELDLSMLSKAINIAKANSVALQLGLSQSDFEIIKHDAQTDLCYRILYKWRNKTGSSATLERLIGILFCAWECDNESVFTDQLKSAIIKVIK